MEHLRLGSCKMIVIYFNKYLFTRKKEKNTIAKNFKTSAKYSKSPKANNN